MPSLPIVVITVERQKPVSPFADELQEQNTTKCAKQLAWHSGSYILHFHYLILPVNKIEEKLRTEIRVSQRAAELHEPKKARLKRIIGYNDLL